MQMKQIFKSAILSLWLWMAVVNVYGSETCFIDNSPLFLYKTINWWYDSLPEESGLLCGKPIKCQNVGNARVVYDEYEKSMQINIEGGFADMLLAFKTCRQCYGPSYFHSQWLHAGFFKDATAVVRRNDAGMITSFVFNHVQARQVRRVQGLEKDLQFVLEGRVGGLSSGQIALHKTDPLLKRCAGATQAVDDITLKIINAKNNAILATFGMVWDR